MAKTPARSRTPDAARSRTPEAAPVRRRTPEAARALILDAAAELLREGAARDVTVAAVMARTGLTREAFYAYFRDRHELITTLVAPLRADLDEHVAAWSSGTGTFAEDGRAALLGIASVYARDGALLRALWEASARDEEAARVWREFTEPAVAAAAERIQREIDAGNLPPTPRDEVLPLVIALVRMNLATFFADLVDTDTPDIETTVTRLHKIWLRTFGAEG